MGQPTAVLNWLLDSVGLIASLIGIWEFVSKRVASRKAVVRMRQAIENKSFAVQKSPRDYVANHSNLHDPQTVVASNLNRQAFSGSSRMSTQIKPRYDLDIVAFLGT
jgi:hypothetical protein